MAWCQRVQGIAYVTRNDKKTWSWMVLCRASRPYYTLALFDR